MGVEDERRIDELARKAARDKGTADNREYERGKREQQEAAHTADQDRSLADIYHTLDKMTGELDRYNTRLTLVEQAFDKFSAVAQALSEKGVTTRAFAVGVGMMIIAIVALYVSSGKHP